MNMIQNAKDQVLDLTLRAYQKAADAGLLPAQVGQLLVCLPTLLCEGVELLLPLLAP